MSSGIFSLKRTLEVNLKQNEQYYQSGRFEVRDLMDNCFVKVFVSNWVCMKMIYYFKILLRREL